MAYNIPFSRIARIAILSLLAYAGGATAALAAMPSHGFDDAFESGERVVDKELSSMRGGSININGTNITLTISQNITTFNPISNVTTNQQFFFSSANIQPANLPGPMIIPVNVSQGVINASQIINATIQTSFPAAILSRGLVNALSGRGH